MSSKAAKEGLDSMKKGVINLFGFVKDINKKKEPNKHEEKEMKFEEHREENKSPPQKDKANENIDVNYQDYFGNFQDYNPNNIYERNQPSPDKSKLNILEEPVQANMYILIK